MVDVQYSRDGSGAWHTVTTTNAVWDGTGYLVQAQADQPASGYWRLSYPGDPTFFQSAVSDPVHID